MGLDQGLIVVDQNKPASTYTNSPPISMYGHYALNLQMIFSGGTNGSAQLQTSLDYQPGGPSSGPAPNAGTWVNYPSSSQSVVGGSSCAWDIFGTGARWFRINFTYSSGAGTISSILAQVKG